MRCPFESAAITSSHSPVVSVSIVSLAEQHFHEFDSDDDGLLMEADFQALMEALDVRENLPMDLGRFMADITQRDAEERASFGLRKFKKDVRRGGGV